MAADPKPTASISKDEARGSQEARERFRRFVLIRDEACVMCGRTEREARQETGYGLEVHHIVRQGVLRDRGLIELMWNPGLGVTLCVAPCHLRHTRRIERVPFEKLPEHVRRFAARHDLGDELLREHPLARSTA